MTLRKKLAKEILNWLLDNTEAVTIKELSKALQVSEKTIWNKLQNEILQELQGTHVTLVKKTNVGIYLEGTQESLYSLKCKLNGYQFTVNQDEEFRRNKLLIDLLKTNDSIAIQDLSDNHYVSRNIILQDLEQLNENLNKYQLMIDKRQNVGVNIIGDEINLRQLLEQTILRQSIYFKTEHHKSSVFDEGVGEVLNDIGLARYLDNAITISKIIQKDLVGQFTDEGNKEIILQILISYYRSEQGAEIEIIHEDPFEMNVHFQNFINIFERCHMFMNKKDYIYLWRRCINNRFVVSKSEEIDSKFLVLSKELLSSVLDIRNNEEIDYLIKNLAFHIYQAVKRSAIGIKVNNPILSKIKQQYGKFYSMVLTNVNRFELTYDISLNEDEIGFITIYICAIYEKNINNQYYKILLVSDEGIGQTQLLSMQIMNNFHNLLIHNTANSLTVTEDKLDDCDFIISTCSLMLQKQHRDKFIRISNFIDQNEIQNIREHILRLGNQDFKKKVSLHQKEEIDFKYFESDVMSREDIFHTYLQIAEQFGYCDNAYIDSVFEREKRASTSIGKGIAIPHGDDSHIKKPAVFVVRNATPIVWGNEKVDIILFLILKFNSIHENKQFFLRLYSCMGKSERIRNVKDIASLNDLKSYILEGDKE